MSKEEASRFDDDESCDSSVDVGFASIDFTDVNFDTTAVETSRTSVNNLSDETALFWERNFVFGDYAFFKADDQNVVQIELESCLQRIRHLGSLLESGKFVDVLKSTETARDFFDPINNGNDLSGDINTLSLHEMIRNQVLTMVDGTSGSSIVTLVEIEMIGVAALNLFLQCNYTGPSLHHKDDTASDTASSTSLLDGINPHPCFSQERLGTLQRTTDSKTRDKKNASYQNYILSELAVDGNWPCQVCNAPYFLLLARSIFSVIADPGRLDWTHSHGRNEGNPNDSTEWPLHRIHASDSFASAASMLQGVCLWNARSAIAHERLVQAREPCITLWNEVDSMFKKCVQFFCPEINSSAISCPNRNAASVMLEWGLAEHHFDKPGKGRSSFDRAVLYSGLDVEVTGAIGKRTKFQSKATAQMLVKAKSAKQHGRADEVKEDNKEDNLFSDQMIQHSDEEILLERIKFDDDEENIVQELSVLDQSILLALCLDVKNTNPADGLTNEEMAAYLARVLDHHDDWMIYSTGLLERSWVEFDRLHARERAILQLQALVDQHTNRLTITQSTRKSIEESAPVQDRLRNLHVIVYPPRWVMIEDLADRYASMGIVTSAAELYLEIELWDHVVECYKRAGRAAQAEKVIRERLAVEETPRMYNALGDITEDPIHYETAIELSKGRFSNAYLSLGSYYFERGELEKSAENYQKAVKVRPLLPDAWFRIGTITMQLGRWDDALRAFSEVVMQEPEDSDAWANIAAVHMQGKKPAEAYPALVESLKHKRSNWRVWLSKLYTCLDLGKYDEAIQACSILLDLRTERKATDGIPPLEEKCVRGVVGGSLQAFHDSRGDAVASDSARRTLTRVHALLDRISSSSDAQPWVFETTTYFHEQTGNFKELIDDLMREYRALQAIPGWEKDDFLVRKVQQVVSQIVHIHQQDKTKEGLTKSRFLIQGVIQKVEAARILIDHNKMPVEIEKLKNLLTDVDENLLKPSN